MKICVLTENYGKDFTGAMTSTYELIKRWIQAGNKVYVMTFHIVGKINKNVIIKKFSNIIQLLHFLRVHNFTHWIGYSDDHFGFLFHLFNIPYLHTYHGNWPNALWHDGIINFIKGLFLMPLYIITIHYAQQIVGVSRHSLHFIAKHNCKYKVIHNGVDVAKNRLSIPIFLKNNCKILMVGNVDKRKFSLLIAILRELSIRIRQHLQVVIYGKIHNHQIYTTLKKYGVKFAGFHSKIPYLKFDLFLSTSKAENLSIATVEAISSGLPVLTFNIGGMKEIVRPQTGVIIPCYHINMMANWLKSMIMYGKMINFNNKYIINDFNWSIDAVKYLKLLREIRL